MISFIVPGEPKAKARPRMSTRTGKAYTPVKTILYENWVKTRYYESIGNKQLEGNIRAYITCYFTIPKKFNKEKRIEAINGVLRPGKRPDLDNVAKAILDSLNGIAYDDDSQVVELIVKKYYAEQPLVKVELEEI